jgi:multidrug efflux pump subunit AcrA (membrane-fusion protein)
MRTFFYSIFCVLLLACNNANIDPAVEAAGREYLPEKNPVDIIVLERTTFYRELVSNGKLRVAGKSVLKFDTGEELAELFVKNGDWVSAGQPIARLRQDRQLRQLEQAKIRMEQAALSLQENLIGQGYNPLISCDTG